MSDYFNPTPSIGDISTIGGKSWRCSKEAPNPIWEPIGIDPDYFGVSTSSATVTRDETGNVVGLSYSNGVVLTINRAAGEVTSITSNTGKTKTVIRWAGAVTGVNLS